MEDIYLDDRRQISAKAAKTLKKSEKGQPQKRRFWQYIVDLFIKGLIASLFVAIDFILFAKAGSYSLFSGTQHINPEAFYIIASIFTVIFVINYMLSFSKLLQNILVTAFFVLFILAIFNQFALFDKNSLLVNSFDNIFSPEITSYLNNNSHLVITAALALLFFFVMSFCSRLTQSYLLGILLFIFGWNMTTAYLNPSSKNFKTIYENAYAEEGSDDGKHFVFLAMPGLTSYNNLKTFINDKTTDKNYNPIIQTAIDSMLGFYTQNNFTLYENAYIKDRNPFVNIISSYNPVNTNADPEEYTLQNVLLQSYWNFDNLNSPTLYLKNNKLFDSFRKNDYNLKVYQTRGIETCYVNNEIAVRKCIHKKNLPINMELSDLNTTQKTILLVDQWLESTGLVKNINNINNIAKLVLSPANFPASEFSTKDLYVINSFKTLDLIAKDIASDKGDNAYFAVIDLPSETYVYNSNCGLKPINQWVSAQSNNSLQKKQAYAEQLTCLYGQLEKFIQKLINEDRLRDTVIVIQGLNNPLAITRTASEDFYEKFTSTQNVNMAIYDPLKNNYSINSEICPASAILKSYLYKKTACSPLDGYKFTEKARQKIMSQFAENSIKPETIQTSLSSFIKWYHDWSQANGISNNLSNLVDREPEALNEPLPEQEVKVVPIAEEISQLEKEEAVKSLSQTVKEEQGKGTPPAAELPNPTVIGNDSETDVSIAENPSATEARLPEAKINIEVKVIDKEEPVEINVDESTNDVIPPFLEDSDNEIPQS